MIEFTVEDFGKYDPTDYYSGMIMITRDVAARLAQEKLDEWVKALPARFHDTYGTLIDPELGDDWEKDYAMRLERVYIRRKE